MEIHLVTGKGGVGKSAVAAALALRLAQASKKTLLVELGEESFYKDYLGLSEISYKPTPSTYGFDVSLWSGPGCLREYAIYLLKIERLYKLFFENPVTRTLINVAPALSELAILGKITSGPPRNVGPKLPYDALVVDAFATGHFLALLRAPLGMTEAVRFGPMAEQSRAIMQVVRDPRITRFHLVCLPEELPVQETLALADDLRDLVPNPPLVWLNKWVDYPDGLRESGPEFEKDFVRKCRRQQESWKELHARFGDRLRRLPFVFETKEAKILQTLAPDVLR